MLGEKIAEARITSKGQVTLPKKVQRALGVSTGDYVLFYSVEGRIVIVGGSVKPKK